jgi:outer membrane protein, heavy metal efflux system
MFTLRSSGAVCRTWLRIVAIVTISSGAACATGGMTAGDLDVAVRERTGYPLRPDGGPALPPDVSLDDGLTTDEAVAIGLWNSPSFQLTLADLGLARADLVEAGLLRNPVLSFLFPWGPKQLEWTLQFPLDMLWQRPQRVAAARLNLESVGQRLVWDALGLVADVRTTFADAVIAERRLALAEESAVLTRRVADLTEARLRAGDLSDLEARGARNDAARLDLLRQTAAYDRDLARLTLSGILGLDDLTSPVRMVASAGDISSACASDDVLLKGALASRPDLRAAELAIEAAGARAKWERSRIVTLVGILDGNGDGSEGAEAGPGLSGDIPIFNRNQGGISRADAELHRASRRYAAIRAQLGVDVRAAAIRVRQAQAARDAWRTGIVPSLETEQRQAESAYQAGEVPLFVLLDVGRRLIDGRMRLLESEAALQKAFISLERSIGRSCIAQ